MTVTYLSENASGGPPSVGDAQGWANNFGQSGLVVFSNYQDVWYPFGVNQGGGSFSIALPGTMLLRPGMEIALIGNPSNADIQNALP